MRPHRELLGLGIGLIVGCLLAVGVLVSRQIDQLAFDEELIARTQSVLGSIETLHAAVQEAEVSQRAYQISGTETDLITFAGSSARLDNSLSAVGSSLTDHPQLARRLTTYRGLVLQYRDFIEMVSAERSARGFEAARAMLAAAPDIPLVAEMRVLLGEMITDAKLIVAGRRERRFVEARAMEHLIGLALLLTVAGGLVVTFQVRRTVRERRASEATLRDTLRQVDERIRQRTNELSLANLDLQEALEARAVALSREQQARAAAERANELKDQFLGTVSHELRTPLNAIVGWVHVLKVGTLSPAEAAHAIEAIDRNARAQAHLIEDLLDVSRMIQGRLVFSRTPTNLRQIVDQAVEAMRPALAAKELILEYESNADEVRVLGDAGRLQQIASSLLSNTLKFTPRQGRIQVQLSSDGVFATLSVGDSGEGIEPDVLPQVFDPFFQAPTRSMRAGLGLGLTIVKELVDLHGGTVSADSRGTGTGATFTVRLPISHAVRDVIQMPPTEPQGEPPVPAAGGKRPRWWRRLARRKLNSQSG